MTASAAGTPWERGRLDSRSGHSKLLFGRMYEDASIEIGAFPPGGRVFCIASAGCTAMQLVPRHRVVAVDINPVQLEYARRRCAGGPVVRGSADRLMGFARAFAPLVGWTRARLRAFLALDDPAEQIAFWRRHLDTRRFRRGIDGMLSTPVLRAVYARDFLRVLPPHAGAVLRERMERCFARHSNRRNPYASALLLGETSAKPPPPESKAIRFVHADAAAFLEGEPPGSFDGFTLSNILDGAGPNYERRLLAAVERAAAPGATMVLRSIREPRSDSLAENKAAEDRAMLWGLVEVRSVVTS